VAPAGSGGNGTAWTLAREMEDRTCTTEEGMKEGVTPSVCSQGTVPGGRTAKTYGSMNAGDLLSEAYKHLTTSRLTCLFWRCGPVDSFRSRRRPVRVYEVPDIFKRISDTTASIPPRLTVFDDKDLRFLDREQRWFCFGTQTERHVAGKTTERTHRRRCHCRW